jgi:SAM-dependent methyltransferase
MPNYPSQYKVDDGVHIPLHDGGQGSSFSYTDGEDFEHSIRKIIVAASDRSLFSPELRAAIWDWRSSCHLSPVRANILRPLQAKCSGRVLELGSGCGIITRYLGELGGDVVALEASAVRASITRQRTADLENVKVVCDRIEDFNADDKFDMVTMIGVLQYARMFSNCGERAELELLRNAARQLNDDGVLVIAIQNKLGLKYFSGFPEPNVDMPYYGIENRYGSDTIIRFGLDEIRNALSSIGLESQQILLPLPDYHMPVSILAPAGSRPNPHFSGQALLALSVGRDRARPDWAVPSFSLERVWESIYSNGLAADLANSFLIVAGKRDSSLDFLAQADNFAWHYSVERHPAFVTAKHFALKEGKVEVKRECLQPQPAPTVPVIHHVEDELYVNGPLWWSSLVKVVNTPGWSAADVCVWARRWLDALCEQAGLGPAVALSLDKVVPGTMFDWTPMNCIETPDGKLRFFDKEWEIQSSLTLSYVVLRGLFGSLVSVASCARPLPGTTLQIIDLLREALRLQSIGITEEHIEKYIAQESSVQHWINHGVDGGIAEPWAKYVKGAKLVVRADARQALAQLEETEGRLAERENMVRHYEELNKGLVMRVARFLKRAFPNSR